MTAKKLIWSNDGYLDDEYGAQFAFCRSTKEGYKALHPPMQCRDYMGEFLYCAKYQTNVEYLDCLTNPDWNKIKLDKKKILLAWKVNEEYLENLKKNIRILHSIEKKNGFTETKLIEVSFNEGSVNYDSDDEDDWGDGNYDGDENYSYFVVEGDSVWQSTQFMLSIYLMLLRCFSRVPNLSIRNWMEEYLKSFEGRDIWSSSSSLDSEYIEGIGDKLKILLPKLHKIEIDPKEVSGWGVRRVKEPFKQAVWDYQRNNQTSPDERHCSHAQCGIYYLLGGEVNEYGNGEWSKTNIYRDQMYEILKASGMPEMQEKWFGQVRK